MEDDQMARTSRKQAPKVRVRTGCFSCRRRRIKCPQQRPVCRRCHVADLDCSYPLAGTQPVLLLSLAPQPSAMMHPDGASPSIIELDLFKEFCTSTVTKVSGAFNLSFWKMDVPRAAAAHPAMWHAGVAMAAMHLHATEVQISGNESRSSSSSGRDTPRDGHYRTALEHFNKSMLRLSKLLAAHDQDHQFSYAEQEMFIMTNMLYLGITSILDDEAQTHSHYKNLLRLLESFRVGEADASACRGIMAYEDLLSVVLALDGNVGSSPDQPERWSRPWVVKLPTYDRIETVAQAYLSFLPLTQQFLQDEAVARGTGPARFAPRRNLLQRFRSNLADFCSANMGSFTSDEEQSVELMRQYADLLHMKEQCLSRTRRSDIIREEKKLTPFLDYVERTLSREPSPSPPSPSSSTALLAQSQLYAYSLSFGSLLELAVGRTNNLAIRRRGIAMMRKWHCNESGMRAGESIGFLEAGTEHQIAGPARTWASQLAGNAVIPTFPDAGLGNAAFDGTRECECIPGLFTCQDHKVLWFDRRNTSDPPGIELGSRYEVRNNLPYAVYYY